MKQEIKDVLEHFGKGNANLESEACREKIAETILEIIEEQKPLVDDKPWWP